MGPFRLEDGGADWVGDPDAGFGPKQSGGWIYNILPFLNQDALRDLGRGLNGQQKRDALSRLLQMPLD